MGNNNITSQVKQSFQKSPNKVGIQIQQKVWKNSNLPPNRKNIDLVCLFVASAFLPALQQAFWA